VEHNNSPQTAGSRPVAVVSLSSNIFFAHVLSTSNSVDSFLRARETLCQPGLMNLQTSNCKFYIIPRLKQCTDVGISGVKLRTSSLRAVGRSQGRLRVLQTPTLASSGQRRNEKSASAAVLNREHIMILSLSVLYIRIVF